nr:hypothetical protein [Prevotella koreensis]
MRNEFSRISFDMIALQERQARVRLHPMLFLQTRALGKCTGISIIDSTPKLFNPNL